MTKALAQTLEIRSPSPEQVLPLPAATKAQCELRVKRDDLLHPIISGNKWRKLHPQLQCILETGVRGVLSFGGGHSNHLHALAFCCHQLNLPLVAMVRGDYQANPTPTLIDLARWRADIRYLTKIEYRQRDEQDYLHALQQQYPDFQIIPEGGSVMMALQGIATIKQELANPYDVIVAPVASGATLAGLIQAFAGTQTAVLGIAVLNAREYLTEQVTRFLPPDSPQAPWQICHDYHFGGYAKSPDELRKFCLDWSRETAIPVEPVYSGKLFFALQHLLETGHFKRGSRILALHTGGLQGART